MSEELLFYSYIGSSSSFRVRIAARLIGVNLKIMPVNLLAGEHKQPEYLNINPLGLVPTLVIKSSISHKEIKISDSIAIVTYLAETNGYNLYPNNLYEKAKVIEIIATIFGIQEASNFYKNTHQESNSKKSSRQKHNEVIVARLPALEKMLTSARSQFTKEHCQYAWDNIPGIIDILLIPQMNNVIRYVEKHDRATLAKTYPLLMNLYETCMKLPEFKEVHPENNAMKIQYGE